MALSRSAWMLFLLVSSFAVPSVIAPCHAETVLLDFSSASCGPCQQMRPIVRQLAESGYRVRDVNVDREPQMAARFHVTQVPTFIVLVDDREADRLTGTASYAQLEQMMTRYSSPATQTPVVPPGQSPPPGGNPFIQASTGQPSPDSGSGVDQRRLIEATVKVAVQDAGGTSAGAGTMVDARSGEALVLTCGHLFRTSAGKGPITVTLYQVGPAGIELRTTVPGNLIDYDLDRDLALVSIRTEVPIQTVAIGPAGVALEPGAAVTTVGCNNGQAPTAIASRITTVDRYQGHPNVEVGGAPVEGRSGGGLFNARGQLIGVCYAADPQADEGLYASLPSIHAKLDSLQLTMVYQSPGGATRTPTDNSAAPVQMAAAPSADFTIRGQNAVAEPPPTSGPVASLMPSQPPPQTASLSPAEQAALLEIQTRGANSEVICIIRPHSPEGKSEVITLTSVSPAFVQALTQGSATAQGPGPASVATASGQLRR